MALTQEQVERAAKLLQDGLTYSQIAERLGVTRNVVLGKMHRAKLAHLTQRPPSAKRRERSDRLAPRLLKIVPIIENGRVLEKRALSDAVEAPTPPFVSDPVDCETDAPARNGLALLELKDHSCRYPLGELEEDSFGFCGARKVHGFYCSAHAQICYEPTRGRR